jgi:hypothetical protein
VTESSTGARESAARGKNCRTRASGRWPGLVDRQRVERKP